ncbi:MAG: DUF6776 family protein [Betaproteobacteria bacterium]
MSAPLWWRRVRQHFGISAPRMAVRTHLPWWSRGALLTTLLVIIAGMWWWGFDFGQIFGGFNRTEIEARLVSIEADAAKYKGEATDLRVRNSTLETEQSMNRGNQEALTKQATELAGENAQLKEELAFLQKLVSDSNKTVGMQIQRLNVEPDGDDMWRYSVLVVRGGSPKDEFTGTMVLQASLAPGVGPAGGGPRTLLLPDDDPSTAPTLTLKFKYYQRVEGRVRVPAGARVLGVSARAYEAGQSAPRASRTLIVG